MTVQNGPTTYTLTDVEGGNKSIITVEARYVPVPVQLEARESVNSECHSQSIH